MEPLLALTMIVKNEAACIKQTLVSVRPFVDRMTICDTGSTDGTQDVIRASFGDDAGRNCHLWEMEFIDFATARNQALYREAGNNPHAKYSLMLSADEVLIGGEALRSFLQSYNGNETCFLVAIETDVDSALTPRVFLTGSNWLYEGAVHERPVNRAEKIDPSVRIPGVTIKHRISDSERRKKRLSEYDLPALGEIVKDTTKDLPTRLRALLILGETHEAIASTKDRSTPGGEWLHGMFLALSLYARRMESGGDAAEVEYAKTHFLNTMSMLGLYDDEEMLKRLSSMENSRLPEVHFMIASHIARLDANAGYERAVVAARLTRAALSELTLRPVNREILWKSHLIAAHCARAIGKPEDASKSAAAGLEAGGVREVFAEFISIS